MSASGHRELKRQFSRADEGSAAQIDIWERLSEGLNAFDRNWRFTYVNRAAEELLGWSRGELLGRSLWDVYPNLVGTRPYREYRRAMEEQVPVVFDEYHDDTGRWFEFRAYPSPDSLHVYFRDVTAQRQRLLEEHTLTARLDSNRSAVTLPATALSHLVALAENTPDRLARFDRDGNYLYVNPALARAVGQPPDAFLGHRIDQMCAYLTSVSRTRLRQGVARVVETGEAVQLHYEEMEPEGQRTWEARLVPEYDAADGARTVSSVLAISRDVTERTRAEATLRQSEERYRALVSATAQVVWTCDPDGLCTEPSLTWEAFTGQSGKEMLGRGYETVIHPDDRGMTRRVWDHAIQTGLPYRIEHRLRRRDGTWRRVVARAVPLRDPDTGAVREWVGTFTDVTDQREAEAALRESEERYEAISSMTSDYAFAYRLEADGSLHLEWITDAFTEDSGYSPEDLDRLGWGGVLHRDDVAHVESMLRRVLVYGQETNLEARMHTREGAVRWLRMYARPRVGKGGVISGLYGAAQDITEQKQAEAEMRSAHQKQRRIAETLQNSLLITPSAGDYPGLEIRTEYEPAWDEAAVGGDFHDTFAVGAPHQVAVVIGDVMGKGLTAAAYTAELKFALRAYLRESGRPSEALSRLNDYVVTAQTLRPDETTALVCVNLALIDTRTGEMEIAVAGMEPPLLLRQQPCRLDHPTVPSPPEEIPQTGSGGPLLGIWRGMEYPSRRTQLCSGDLLVLFTDGVTEARSMEGSSRFFGPEGVAAAARRALQQQTAVPPDGSSDGGEGGGSETSLSVIGRSILEEARAFTHQGKLGDDACLLLVRRSS